MSGGLPGRLRSMLFAPADRPELLRKLPRAGADAVVLDCEDGTALSRKAEARVHAREVGAELAAAGETVVIRLNGPGTDLLRDDVAEAIPDGAAAVILPSVGAVRDLDDVAQLLADTRHRALPVIAGIETAAGVAEARALLAHQAVAAAYFGAEDYIADMGGVRTEGNAEVAWARGAVALAARLARVPVLDQVTVAYADHARFSREAEEARAMGYAGKLCIHPAQVPLAHAAFTPGEEEVARARRVVEAFEAADGGVVSVDGRMIDAPLVAHARRVLTLADADG